MRTRSYLAAALAAAATATACKSPPPPVLYQAVPVETRDIVVSAQAAGKIVPDTLVEVKTRASGPVTDIKVETGQLVQRGQLLLVIDERLLKNTYDQASAQLEVAKVQSQTAETQLHRADTLLASQTLTKQDYETYKLNYYNTKAQVVNAQIAVDNAKINLDEASVRSPITGTIIEKSVERGTQVASATSNVGGGTSLMKMADLSLVQAQTLVDETDIGKIKPGMEATVTVDAYPNRPFHGTVLKIEPNDTTVQNVTMFPVRVRIQNRDNVLLPGMNSEVEIHIGQKQQVLAVPASALRTPRDVASAAQVLGLDPAEVQKTVAAGPPRDSSRNTSLGGSTPSDGTKRDSAARSAKPAEAKGNVMTTPDGREIPLPPGVTEEQVRAAFAKRRSGSTLTPAEDEMMTKVRAAMQRSGGGRAGGGQRGNDYQFGGSYIVFVSRGGKPTPVYIRTGLTDLDYAEVTSGLQPGDSVFMLPSASLVQSQQQSRQRIQQMTGGGLGGMRQQQQPAAGATGAPAAGATGGGAGGGGNRQGGGRP